MKGGNMKNKKITKILDKLRKGKILPTDDEIRESNVNIFTLINLMSKELQRN